jgi:uncharacterized protein DUF4396
MRFLCMGGLARVGWRQSEYSIPADGGRLLGLGDRGRERLAPQWANVVGWVFLSVAFACALTIIVDEFLLGRRQAMWIMNLVHPITALYWGPVWLWLYLTRGRRMAKPLLEREADALARRGADPRELEDAGKATDGNNLRPWHVGNAVSHCGAGCTLGDIGGEWIVWGLGAPTLGASGTLGPELIADFVPAWTLGVVFQYFTIVPMRDDVGPLRGIWLAIRADTLSIVAFQVGLFGWMALSHFVIWPEPLHIDTAAHWWMMQVGMIVGFFTAWPVNRWLIRRGWKEKMDRRSHLAPLVRERQRTGEPLAAQPVR